MNSNSHLMDDDGLDDGDGDDGGSEGAGPGNEQQDKAFEVDLDIDLEATALTEMFQGPSRSLASDTTSANRSPTSRSGTGERNETISWDF
jgi:hypothetical protein